MPTRTSCLSNQFCQVVATVVSFVRVIPLGDRVVASEAGSAAVFERFLKEGKAWESAAMFDDAIFEETLDLLRYHFHPELGDRTPFDVFTRLVAKRIRRPKWKSTDHERLRRSHIASERQTRSTKQLSQLVREHTRDRPWNESAPIIIAFYLGQELLLDGTARINKWMRERNDGDHAVNFHIIE
jgi:hypothetical protein